MHKPLDLLNLGLWERPLYLDISCVWIVVDKSIVVFQYLCSFLPFFLPKYIPKYRL